MLWLPDQVAMMVYDIRPMCINKIKYYSTDFYHNVKYNMNKSLIRNNIEYDGLNILHFASLKNTFTTDFLVART